jgi:putative ABC transport system ATP-binding protein
MVVSQLEIPRELVARFDDVCFTYRSAVEVVLAVQEVNFSLYSGDFVCLLGASGSGKTTLLNLLAGLDVAESGTVHVLGKDLGAMGDRERTALRLDRVGMVFQDNNLVAQFTARENVELILRCQTDNDPVISALELLREVGVEELADRRPGDMSGGQRQRVGIARALAGHRAVLICDEPTGHLDRANSLALFTTLRDLAHTRGMAVLVATHDPDAVEFADRVVRMRDGRLSEES